VDDAVAQVALGAVVGGLDVVAVEADEQLVAMAAVALLELPSFPDADREAEDQPIGRAFDPDAPIGERGGRDLVPLAMQTQRPAEDVAQLARPLRAGRTVDLDGVGQVPDLVGEAELVLGGRGRVSVTARRWSKGGRRRSGRVCER
jgi:hypothetical protein